MVKENTYLVEGMVVLPFPLSSSSPRKKMIEEKRATQNHLFMSGWKVTGGRTPALTSFQAEFELPSKPPYPWLGDGFSQGTGLGSQSCTLGKPMAVPMPFHTHAKPVIIGISITKIEEKKMRAYLCMPALSLSCARHCGVVPVDMRSGCGRVVMQVSLNVTCQPQHKKFHSSTHHSFLQVRTGSDQV